jgi:hypothetical protein
MMEKSQRRDLVINVPEVAVQRREPVEVQTAVADAEPVIDGRTLQPMVEHCDQMVEHNTGRPGRVRNRPAYLNDYV